MQEAQEGVQMPGLSRRAFLAAAGATAAAWGLPRTALLAVEEPVDVESVPTTLRETILQRSRGPKQYRTLTTGPGEDYIPRFDLLGRRAEIGRVNSRRSLAYLGHMSDIHVIDAQSPARLEPMQQQSRALWAGAIRPQDTLTLHVLAAHVAAFNAATTSPVTGAPMAALINTGDSADMLSELELRWYIDTLDGQSATANSGADGIYEGPQVWAEADYAWHPDNPASDLFGAYGFPQLPGMLQAAISEPTGSPGLAVPWFAVYGNHDSTFFGTFGSHANFDGLAIGGKKYWEFVALATDYLGGQAAEVSLFSRWANNLGTQLGRQPGAFDVTADSRRALFDAEGFIRAHLDSGQQPGPVGHGFTQADLAAGRTYWQTDLGPGVRLFALDTCNAVVGADGAVPQDQFDWLDAELDRCDQEQVLALIASHHNSLTLENTAVAVGQPSQPLIHAEQFLAMLQRHPSCIAWLNGHTHNNTIQAHPNSDGGGLWEITTASCIDFPQQQQLVEIVDNTDGTLSIFTTTIDHLSPAQWRSGDYSATGLASLSRELASNDWINAPLSRRGSPLDRNAELLLAAPFEMSGISDADLERADLSRKARIEAHRRRTS